jgi:hypothetical protein
MRAARLLRDVRYTTFQGLAPVGTNEGFSPPHKASMS